MQHFQTVGALFTLILGTLLHFVYDWSGKNGIVSLFGAANESTWEHLKLLVMPILLFGAAEYFVFGKQIQNFIPVKLLSLLLGMSVIIVTFYTYVGLVGRHFLWADIGVFVLGVVAAYCFSAHFLQTDHWTCSAAVRAGRIGLFLLVACFALFTFYPPQIGLFLDPVSRRYGRS